MTHRASENATLSAFSPPVVPRRGAFEPLREAFHQRREGEELAEPVAAAEHDMWIWHVPVTSFGSFSSNVVYAIVFIP